MSGQGNHIKSFDTIRPRLRRILAGLSLGGRPESGDRILWTRVRHFLEDEKVYNVRRIGHRRVAGLRTDRYRGSTNYLITLYRSKTFAPRRLAILLLVLQLLGAAPSGLPMQSLLEEVQRRIPQVPKKRREDVSEDGSQTARELCTRLKDLGIVRTSGHTTQCVWQIADDALGGLTAGELDARRTRRLLVLTYCGRRGSSEGEIYHLWPLRIEEDVWQGNRQTLVGILYEPRRAARASAHGDATAAGGAAHDLTIAADDPWTLVPFVQEHAPDLALTDAPAPIRARLAENLRAALANYGKEAAPDGGEA